MSLFRVWLCLMFWIQFLSVVVVMSGPFGVSRVMSFGGLFSTVLLCLLTGFCFWCPIVSLFGSCVLAIFFHLFFSVLCLCLESSSSRTARAPPANNGSDGRRRRLQIWIFSWRSSWLSFLGVTRWLARQLSGVTRCGDSVGLLGSSRLSHVDFFLCFFPTCFVLVV